MDEKPDKIVRHIEEERNRLGQNLDELQNRVRETADWRAQFDKHPYMLMGAAMGGGLLLSAMVTGGPKGSYSSSSGSYRRRFSEPEDEGSSFRSSYRERPYNSRAFEMQKQRAWGTFENIKGALVGWAAAKAQDYLSDMLPGFREHFNETQNRGGQQQHFAQQQGEWNRGNEGWQGHQQQQHEPWRQNEGWRQHEQGWQQGREQFGAGQRGGWAGQNEPWRQQQEPQRRY